MNKFAKISVAIALAAAAAAANAQVYGEVAYTAINLQEDTLGLDADLGLVGVTVGYEAHKNLAVEAVFATGVTDDDVAGVNIDAKHSYGVFLKPKAALGPNFEVFAKLGWAKTKLEASGGGATAGDSDSDFAYGVGLQYSFTPKAYVTGGYMNVYDKDGLEADGWTIGVGYKF